MSEPEGLSTEAIYRATEILADLIPSAYDYSFLGDHLHVSSFDALGLPFSCPGCNLNDPWPGKGLTEYPASKEEGERT
jgi:hypothetical protein